MVAWGILKKFNYNALKWHIRKKYFFNQKRNRFVFQELLFRDKYSAFDCYCKIASKLESEKSEK